MSENMPKKGSNTGWYIAAAVIIIIIIIAGVLAYQYLAPSPLPSPSPSSSTSPSATPTSSGSATTMDIYGGEVTTSTYGFGNSADSLSSPGPTITLKVGQSYTMTFHNVGTTVHGWEIVSSKEVGTPLFGAGIGVNNYLSPGTSLSVTFTPDQSGNFYYICPVPGHIALGMWGNVVVNP